MRTVFKANVYPNFLSCSLIPLYSWIWLLGSSGYELREFLNWHFLFMSTMAYAICERRRTVISDKMWDTNSSLVKHLIMNYELYWKEEAKRCEMLSWRKIDFWSLKAPKWRQARASLIHMSKYKSLSEMGSFCAKWNALKFRLNLTLGGHVSVR